MLRLDPSRRRRPPASRPARPAVSVCIVNWNCKALLRRCLRSLTAARQGLRLEVVVVDNASADGAADMVAAEFPRVRLVRNDANVGFAKGCNQAARLAQGRFLFFLNNDTVVPRLALAKLVEFARSRPEAGLVGPRLRDGDGRVQCSARRRPTVAALCHRLTMFRWTGLFRAAYHRYRGRELDVKTARPVEVLMGAALLMPRRLYRDVGGWDEGFTFGGEDIELSARVSRTHEVIYYPSVEVRHLGRAASREHTGYATANTLVGVTRSLRAAGTGPAALTAYKLAFTLDLPLRAAALAGRYLASRLLRKGPAAGRARAELLGLAYFARRSLGAFWRA